MRVAGSRACMRGHANWQLDKPPQRYCNSQTGCAGLARKLVMETTEKIIECYVRHVLRWATIPNIKCDGQYEIDLIAIDPVNLERYHIESSVSASKGFSRLTAKSF